MGAYGNDVARGAAYVFVRSGGTWTEQQKLVASDGVEGDDFGWSVSLAADHAVVGAYAKDAARGAAYVFAGNGGSWTEEQRLVPSDGVEGDDFGWSVSLADALALVGAPGHDAGRGAAYAFLSSGGSWTEEQKLAASDGESSDQFAVSVSLAADRALLGAYWEDSLRGAAYVFGRNGGSWSEERKLVASDGVDGDRFGGAVSLGAERALIGAYAKDSSRGGAYVFARDGSDWTEEEQLVAGDGAYNDLFGWSVALAPEHAVVGAHYDDNLRGTGYVFSLGLADGEGCSADTDCASGHCVDDRCCNVACTGSCGACSVAEGAATDGILLGLPRRLRGKPTLRHPCL